MYNKKRTYVRSSKGPTNPKDNMRVLRVRPGDVSKYKTFHTWFASDGDTPIEGAKGNYLAPRENVPRWCESQVRNQAGSLQACNEKRGLASFGNHIRTRPHFSSDPGEYELDESELEQKRKRARLPSGFGRNLSSSTLRKIHLYAGELSDEIHACMYEASKEYIRLPKGTRESADSEVNLDKAEDELEELSRKEAEKQERATPPDQRIPPEVQEIVRRHGPLVLLSALGNFEEFPSDMDRRDETNLRKWRLHRLRAHATAQ